jgi:hypothetical protein
MKSLSISESALTKAHHSFERLLSGIWRFKRRMIGLTASYVGQL